MKVNKKVSKLIIFTLTSSITMMSFNSLVFADNFNKTYVDNKISDPIIKIEESEYFEEKTADRPVPMMTASALALGGGKVATDVIGAGIVTVGGYIIHKATEHTKPRPGRNSEKKKQKPNWKPRK